MKGENKEKSGKTENFIENQVNKTFNKETNIRFWYDAISNRIHKFKLDRKMCNWP